MPASFAFYFELLLSSGAYFGWAFRLDELVEESAVIDHGSAQLFCRGLGLTGADGDGVGGAVILEDAGVIDRDIFGDLRKAGDGIAACLQKGGDELICFGNRALGMIDKAGFHGAPVGHEAVSLRSAELPEGEFFDARLTFGEAGFRFAFGAMFDDGVVVLRAEAFAQLKGVAFAHAGVSQGAEGEDQDNCDHND